MKSPIALVIVVSACATTGCVADQTRNMAEACQNLLAQRDASGNKAFIEDAEAQLAALDRPQNRVTAYLRDLQDPEAMEYKPALEQCVWLLKTQRK